MGPPIEVDQRELPVMVCVCFGDRIDGFLHAGGWRPARPIRCAMACDLAVRVLAYGLASSDSLHAFR